MLRATTIEAQVGLDPEECLRRMHRWASGEGHRVLVERLVKRSDVPLEDQSPFHWRASVLHGEDALPFVAVACATASELGGAIQECWKHLARITDDGHDALYDSEVAASHRRIDAGRKVR